jgi:hypothetical protein
LIGIGAGGKIIIDSPAFFFYDKFTINDGPLAQLGERFAGSEEVSGSIPLRSTKLKL